MGKKLTSEEFIERAKAVHGDKYDYSKVNYVNNYTKVCIICPKHGEFNIQPLHLMRGHGCRKCSTEINSLRKIILAKEGFIEKARKVHGDKYDYSKVEYLSSKKKVCITCSIHGDFWQTPNDHLSGANCPICGEITKRRKRKTSLSVFVERARAVHGDKYDYSKVNYVDCKTKVCIICPIHGEFWQTPDVHLDGCGCKECGLLESKNKNKSNSFVFIGKARKIHGDKYDYSKVEYVNAHEKVCITCPIHGDFLQQPNSHLRGCGCFKCSSSHLENEVSLFLQEHKIQFEKEKTFNWLVKEKNLLLDFYLPQYNIAIECQGEQHFRPIDFGGNGIEAANKLFERNKQRDELKMWKCKENGVKLIHYNPFEKYFGTYENEIHNMEELEKMLINC